MSRTRGKKIEYEEIESSDDELSRLELDALEEYEGDDDGSRVVVDKSKGSLKVTIAFDDAGKLTQFSSKEKDKSKDKSRDKNGKDKRLKKKKESSAVSESLDEEDDLDDEEIDDLDLADDDDEGDGIPVDYNDDDDDEDDEDLFDYDEDGKKNIDLSKLSDRQRAKYLGQSEEPDELKNELLNGKNLPKSVLMLMEGSQKKQLTEEEIELRKADAARKRKHFVMKKLEAEKKETLRKLLHRKVEKVDSRKQEEENERNRLNKLKRAELLKHKALFSWVSKTEGEGIDKCAVSYYSMQ